MYPSNLKALPMMEISMEQKKNTKVMKRVGILVGEMLEMMYWK